MQSKKDKAQYDMEYQRTHMKRVTLWFNIEKDADILDWLDQCDTSKSETIKLPQLREVPYDQTGTDDDE